MGVSENWWYLNLKLGALIVRILLFTLTQLGHILGSLFSETPIYYYRLRPKNPL